MHTLIFFFIPDTCQGKWIHWCIICLMKTQGMFRTLRLEGCQNKSESCERYLLSQNAYQVVGCVLSEVFQCLNVLLMFILNYHERGC